MGQSLRAEFLARCLHGLFVLEVPLDVGRRKHLSVEQVHPGVVVQVGAVGPERVVGVVTFGAELPEVETAAFAGVRSAATCIAGQADSMTDGLGHCDAGSSVQELEVQHTTMCVGPSDERDLVGHRGGDVRGQTDVIGAQAQSAELDGTDVDRTVAKFAVLFPLAHEGRVGIPADSSPSEQLGMLELDGEHRTEPGRCLGDQKGGEGHGTEPAALDELCQVVPEGEVAGERLFTSLEGSAVQKLSLRVVDTNTDGSSIHGEFAWLHDLPQFSVGSGSQKWRASPTFERRKISLILDFVNRIRLKRLQNRGATKSFYIFGFSVKLCSL
jgi:hypothetical protein